MSLKTIHIAALFVIAISDFWCVCTGTHALLKSNPEYDQKRHELFEHYYPIEICPTLPANEKAKYMEEWYVMQTHCNSTGPPSHLCVTSMHIVPLCINVVWYLFFICWGANALFSMKYCCIFDSRGSGCKSISCLDCYCEEITDSDLIWCLEWVGGGSHMLYYLKGASTTNLLSVQLQMPR